MSVIGKRCWYAFFQNGQPHEDGYGMHGRNFVRLVTTIYKHTSCQSANEPHCDTHHVDLYEELVKRFWQGKMRSG
jgi:hypothetical protein